MYHGNRYPCGPEAGQYRDMVCPPWASVMVCWKGSTERKYYDASFYEFSLKGLTFVVLYR